MHEPPASASGSPSAGSTPGPCIVVVEDEPQIRRFLCATLSSTGYRLYEATTGEDGLLEVTTRQPDVVIVDLGLPDMDGLQVIRQLREWTKVPIIVLSARGQERDKIAALDAGADDYVSKPFSVGELLARLRVAPRHAAGSGETGEPTFSVGGLGVDQLRRQVVVDGKEVHLTPIEYRLPLDSLGCKPVTNTRLGQQVARARGIGLERATQLGHVDAAVRTFPAYRTRS